MENYSNITELLKSDSSLSLFFRSAFFRCGVRKVRSVSIMEPNPHKGKVANPGSGLDQQYCHGPRWDKRGYDFDARCAIEGLDLLEKKCSGDEDVKSIVSYDSRGDETVHGSLIPIEGLDSWLFHNFCFEVRPKEDGLYAVMKNNAFHSKREIIYDKKVDSVLDAVSLFEDNVVSDSTLYDLKTGLTMDYRTQKCMRFVPKEKAFLDVARNMLSESFVSRYEGSLEELKPFEFTKEVKDSLLIGMFLNEFYTYNPSSCE
ncbi:hypothetical protein KY321_04565 [Candidatus Woesearchaeota archaeon]|nr:hypothetical protein [Candidatus Woesearchaeota archaeon]